MADLGVTPEKGSLVLATGGDFVWTYRWQPGPEDPAQFPTGTQLDLLVGDADVFPFTVDGDTATIKIESDVADLIADRAPFRLRFTEPTQPSTETILVYGQVKRIEPRG